jgi:hypothetical protein
MYQSGIDTDDKRRPRNFPCYGVEWPAFADVRTWMPSGDALSSLPFGTGAPRQDEIKAVAANDIGERDPVRFRPFLIRPRCPVQQHGIASVGHCQAGPIEAIVRRALGHKSKGVSGEDPIAFDCM